MRLVGASNQFVSGPYIVTGILYGILSALVGVIIFIPLVMAATPYLLVLLPQMRLSAYFIEHLMRFLGLGLLFGTLLGAFSSFIAARKYLTI